MNFGHSWVALLALLPLLGLIWLAVSRQLSRRLALKILAAIFLLLALSQPSIEVYESKLAVGLLVDTSQSVSDSDLETASSFVKAAQRASGRNDLEVIPFAAQARQSEPLAAGGARIIRAEGEAKLSTNLEAAVEQGLSLLPANRIHRLVLLSDGKENQGSIARALWQARELGVPIDTVPLAGQPQPKLRLETVALPSEAFSGERFPVDLAVSAPESRSAKIELSAEGKPLGASTVELRPGLNQVRVHVSVRTVGSVELQGEVSSEGFGSAAFTQAVNLRKPRALILSDDPPTALEHLIGTLRQADFEVETVNTLPSARLARFQLIVLNNQDLHTIPNSFQRQLEQFVERGGGLLYIAGEHSVYKETEGPEQPIERVLPARIAPPQSPKGNCVVLIVDKSSSMEGRKMELARVAAIGAIDNLRPVDQVGVLIFDNSFEWTVPIRKARNSSLIKRLVSGITPDGGTQIAPALEEAYRRTLPVQAVVKHIVLLTDGISEEGNSIPVSREAGENKITISTIGLGQDVNRAYLEKIADLSGGRAYFLTDPSALQQILLRDVQEYTGTTAVEKAVRAEVVRDSEILKGVPVASAPDLEGYIRFEPKTAAERILNIGGEDRDPLLVRWQFGLGRSVVFTSDATNRWASKWIGWPGYDSLWSNIARDLLPHARAGEAALRYDSATGELIADYRLAPYMAAPEPLPDLYVIGPEDFRRPLPLRKVAEGAYEGRLDIGERRGLFRVRPLKESEAFPELGLYRQQPELFEYGSDEDLLRRIAAFTGGQFNPEPSQIFRPASRVIPNQMPLWPLLLILGLLSNFAELIIRKWGAVQSLFERRERVMAGG